MASTKLRATTTVASSRSPLASPVYPIAMLEQGTTITSRKPSARSGSDRKTVARTQPTSGAQTKLKSERDPDPAQVPPGAQERLEPDVDHHRVDDQEDRGRRETADGLAWPSSSPASRVAGQQADLGSRG